MSWSLMGVQTLSACIFLNQIRLRKYSILVATYPVDIKEYNAKIQSQNCYP